MSLHRWYRKAEEALHIDKDPLDRFNFEPANENHQRLLEDLRKTILTQTDTCFRQCADIQTPGFTTSEDRCVDSCLEKSLKVARRLVEKGATPPKKN